MNADRQAGAGELAVRRHSTRAISRDYEAVRAALRKALAAPAGLPVEIPLDLQQWLAHLGWLRSSLDAGVLEPGELTADEAEGLRIAGEVSRELAEQQACPRCAALLPKHARLCTSCGASLVPQSAARGAS